MIIQFKKNFKKVKFSISVGFTGKIYVFGNLPNGYKEHKNNIEFLKNRSFYVEHLVVYFLPSICYFASDYSNTLCFDWLFVNFKMVFINYKSCK